jgi:hypothetical protein
MPLVAGETYNLVWEGFVPATVPNTLINPLPAIMLDTEKVHHNGEMQWESLTELFTLLQLRDLDSSDFNHLAGRAVLKITVTVTAMERAEPWTSTLILASRGERAVRTTPNRNPAHSLNHSLCRRPVTSHSGGNPQSGVFIEAALSFVKSEEATTPVMNKVALIMTM